MKAISCQVQSLESLTDHVYKVLLKPAENVEFLPGQYLNFVMSEEDKRPFSIASAPGSSVIELQIGAFGEDGYAMQVIDRIKQQDTVTVEMAGGNAHLRTHSERPLLLIAGGTGFSYIKSIFEFLTQQKSDRAITIYWGLRNGSACYELEKTQATIAVLKQGKFYPVIENPDQDWQGKTGMVHQVVMNDIDNLADYDIYLAGRFDMVGAIRTDFVARGAKIEHMYADAFAYI